MTTIVVQTIWTVLTVKILILCFMLMCNVTCRLLLTLGAHAPDGYSTWSVCVTVLGLSVCVSVCFPSSGTSRNQASKQQYQQLHCNTGMKFKKGFFFTTLRSEVMASFTHRE